MAVVDRVYKNLLRDIEANGSWRDTRSGRCKSVFGKFIELDIRNEFPIITSKFVSPRAVIGELLWFMNGETTIEELKYRTFGDRDSDRKTIWCPDFERWSKTDHYNEMYRTNCAGQPCEPLTSELGPIYGYQWISQLPMIVDRIKNNPNDRRLIVDSWDNYAIEENEMALPPCHYAYQLYVEGDYIDLMWHQRSVDVFLGLPFNIFSYGLLMHLIGQMTDKKPRFLKCSLGDTHIYENSVDAIYQLLENDEIPGFNISERELKKINISEYDDLMDLTADNMLHLFKDYQHAGKISVDVCVG